MAKLLALLGVEVQTEGGRVMLEASKVQSIEAPYDLVKTMRASILALGSFVNSVGRSQGVVTWRMCHWNQARESSS